MLALTALRELESATSRARAKKQMLQAIEAVAGLLGNTRAVCRKSYIHPAVLDCHVAGAPGRVLKQRQVSEAVIAAIRWSAREMRRAA